MYVVAILAGTVVTAVAINLLKAVWKEVGDGETDSA
jgi:fructose-specific phosphotransferase system IIC component